MKTMVAFETRVKMAENFEKALVKYNRTGNPKVLSDAQLLMKTTYRKELSSLPERAASKIVNNLVNDDIQTVASRAQRIRS